MTEATLVQFVTVTVTVMHEPTLALTIQRPRRRGRSKLRGHCLSQGNVAAGFGLPAELVRAHAQPRLLLSDCPQLCQRVDHVDDRGRCGRRCRRRRHLALAELVGRRLLPACRLRGGVGVVRPPLCAVPFLPAVPEWRHAIGWRIGRRAGCVRSRRGHYHRYGRGRLARGHRGHRVVRHRSAPHVLHGSAVLRLRRPGRRSPRWPR